MAGIERGPLGEPPLDVEKVMAPSMLDRAEIRQAAGDVPLAEAVEQVGRAELAEAPRIVGP